MGTPSIARFAVFVGVVLAVALAFYLLDRTRGDADADDEPPSPVTSA